MTLLHEEDGSLAERLSEAYDKAVGWTTELLDIFKLIDAGDYDEALVLAIASGLPPEVRAKLEKILVTEDPDLITQVVNEYKGRLGQVFCEACWEEKE